MTRLLPAALACLLASPAVLTAQEDAPGPRPPSLTIRIGLPSLGGSARSQKGPDQPTATGNRLYFGDTLDLAGDRASVGFEARFLEDNGSSIFKGIRLSLASFAFQGSADLPESAAFDGKTFAAGDRLRSAMNYDVLGVEAVLGGPSPDYPVEVGVGIRVTEFSLDLESPSAHADEFLRLLWLGARVRWRIEAADGGLVIVDMGTFISVGVALAGPTETWLGGLFELGVGYVFERDRIRLEIGISYAYQTTLQMVDDMDVYMEGNINLLAGGPYFGVSYLW